MTDHFWYSHHNFNNDKVKLDFKLIYFIYSFIIYLKLCLPAKEWIVEDHNNVVVAHAHVQKVDIVIDRGAVQVLHVLKPSPVPETKIETFYIMRQKKYMIILYLTFKHRISWH